MEFRLHEGWDLRTLPREGLFLNKEARRVGGTGTLRFRVLPLADQYPLYLGLPTEIAFPQYFDLGVESLQRQIDSFIFATKYGTKLNQSILIPNYLTSKKSP